MLAFSSLLYFFRSGAAPDPWAWIAMLARNLLYTGVTCGKQLVVVIGQPRALAIAVRNVRATQRLTNLAARLREGERAQLRS